MVPYRSIISSVYLAFCAMWNQETSGKERQEWKEGTEHEIEMQGFGSSDKHQGEDIPSAEESLKIFIENWIREDPQRSGDCCIYRVSKRLRDFNNAAYTPEVVSIGPFHRGIPDLQDMEEQKMRYVHTFIKQFGSGFFWSCTRMIREHEEIIRHYYAKRIDMSSDEFVQMILLDAIFIIGFMITVHEDAPCNILVIEKDMILLENQIPFFILDFIFNLAYPDLQGLLIQISIEFFKYLFLAGSLEYPKELPYDHDGEVKHFVDLLRLCHLPSSLVRRESKYTTSRFRVSSATKLTEVGMQFKKRSCRGQGLLDIEYKDKMRTLEIPPFIVSYYTEHVLKNMVALEQFRYGHNTYITDYVIFMDALIDTSKDVDLLIEHNIIENFRGDSCEVSKIFNNFTDQVAFYPNNYYYNDISQRLNKYCEYSWNTWCATLKRDYCHTPWMMASTAAAIVLLLLAFTQTILSVFSFLNSK